MKNLFQYWLPNYLNFNASIFRDNILNKFVNIIIDNIKIVFIKLIYFWRIEQKLFDNKESFAMKLKNNRYNLQEKRYIVTRVRKCRINWLDLNKQRMWNQ